MSDSSEAPDPTSNSKLATIIGFVRRRVLMILSAILAVTAVAMLFLVSSEKNYNEPPLALTVLSGAKDKCLLSSSHIGHEAFLEDVSVDLAKDVVEAAAKATFENVRYSSLSKRDEILSSSKPIYLYHLDKMANGEISSSSLLRCIVIARGHVGDVADLGKDASLFDSNRQKMFDPQSAFSYPGIDHRPFFPLRELHFDDYPASYFEFGVEQDTAGYAARLVPLVVYFRDSIDPGNINLPRTVRLSVAATLPSSPPAGSLPFEGAPVIFRTTVEIDNLYTGSVDGIYFDDGSNENGFQSAWFSLNHLPGLEFQASLAQEARTKGYHGLPYWPATLSVTYTDFVKPSWFATFLGYLMPSSSQEHKPGG